MIGRGIEMENNLQKIQILHSETELSCDDLKQFIAKQEELLLCYVEYSKLCQEMQQMGQVLNDHDTVSNFKIDSEKTKMKIVWEQNMDSLNRLKLYLLIKIKERLVQITAVQSCIIDEKLIELKRNQQFPRNDSLFNPGNLDLLQTECEELGEIILANITHVKELKRLNDRTGQYFNKDFNFENSLCEYYLELTKLLSQLITGTFIIEKQPPQVLKTNTRFSAKVRLLAGGKLNVHMTSTQVKVSIINEAQANCLLTENGLKDGVGNILNNIRTLEYENQSQQVSATFDNMQLKTIKRAERKGLESVVDEKFCFHFSSEISVGEGELVFSVWTLSLPVTVIVHGNQEPHAWATIIWDNAFAEAGRRLFVVPDKKPWPQVADALNSKFSSAIGRGLSVDDMKYLAEKMFGTQTVGYDKLVLTWSKFSKEPLTGRSFAFWDWFYAIMKLTRDYLHKFWEHGYIRGFVQKQQAEDMLRNCVSGTFLLRFSDSELGGITIAWVGNNGDQKVIYMLQPFTAKDFAMRSLADRLHDFDHLLYLYPHTPKDQAFGQYYTLLPEHQVKSSIGYWKQSLINHIPGLDRSNALGGNLISGFIPSTTHTELHSNSPMDNTFAINEATITEPENVQKYSSYTDLFNVMDSDVGMHNESINFFQQSVTLI